MSKDSQRDRIPGAIASIRDALGSVRASLFSWSRARELEIERLRQVLREKETEISRHAAARTRLEQQLKLMRTRDPGTGLPNRSAFAENLQRRLDSLERSRDPLWLAVVRLWQFDQLRDSLGESIATELMREVASRITRAFGTHVELSRIGDKEFGLIIPSSASLTAGGTASRLIGIIEDQFKIGTQGVYLHAVVGLATSETGIDDASELIDSAGLAADDAIARGEKWVSFREERQEEVVSRLQLDADLQLAVSNGEFLLYFQPVVDVATRSIVGFEALLRWAHPSGSLILPDQFIPVAEGNGIMAQISEWVFRTGIKQIGAWRDLLRPGMYVSMNLTPRDLNPAFCAEVVGMVEEAGIAPEHVGVEITETAVVRDFKQAAVLIRELSDRGIRVLLDDFGTGYSSMSYLRDLPFNCVKIDKSFIHRMAIESRDFGLVRSIVGLVQYLEMECIAEGVESREQLDLIAMIDCNYWQGNLFSRPAPPNEIEELLRQHANSVRLPTAG